MESVSRLPEPDVVLDCRGLYCPLPLLRTRAAMDELEPGQLLALVSTDPASIADITGYSRVTGHQLVHQRTDSGEHHFLLRKR